MVSSASPMASCRLLNKTEQSSPLSVTSFIGTNKTFINTCGTLGNLTEDEFIFERCQEKLLFSYADRGVRVINIRLSPIVHGEHGKENPFVAEQIAVAKKAGFVGYVGEGANIWPTVYVKGCGVLQSGGKITTTYTKEWTGWEPKGPSLWEDLEEYNF
ncbi:hypothetical protein DL96DRAFT_1560860 [Flagelloscypha sp. PMI_526]|nr:hypothetical protein DL96DRAFT_1560860 [Flagelloscypha sp. PMI_526]